LNEQWVAQSKHNDAQVTWSVTWSGFAYEAESRIASETEIDNELKIDGA
jgi:hypothetical protein